ncbi:MAG: D-sedoheptulose 7-phosphate isomerase [Rhodospirillaceae bacterium]|jgi:D-sedoheptulose 7-phosphate isomerase|nr:D-sedoheptulose 7-phosphate isomerase [Rhodospirillaceae bacterium]MBT5266473.1 D-sedoheptulose 7-phosphate isomerase [Rhodospirillaceae bacterium]MBT6139464.1 D-sedoheptulose 7-phosphate isomerase [Rhodospirillaceae bacterium]
MEIESYYQDQVARHLAAAEAVRDALGGDFARLVEACVTCVRAGGKLLFFGNGGSAADAQHLATEMTVRYIADRDPIAAIALHADGSAMTATGNDLGFEHVFSRQIEALGRPGDVAIGISTSGHSPNVLLALKVAREKGLVATGLSGRDGGEMRTLADPLLVVPADETARIQEMHILLGHMLCGAVEIELGLTDTGKP